MRKITWPAAGAVGAAVVALAAASAGPEPGPAAADDTPRVERIGEMSVERAAHQATPLPGGGILVTGGCGADGCAPIHASAEIHDPAAGTFRPAASMGTPRASHGAVALADGRVLVVGGWTGREATATAEVYDPEADRWTAAGEMTVARMSPAVAPLPDGHVLITGGEPRTGAAHASAEVFDPATATFSAVDPMRTRRSSHVAVVLDDGRVLVVGGHEDSGAVLRSAEVFDPETGAFRPAGEMAVPRHKHGAALLPDGRVLVVGGSDAADFRGRYTSTETYDPDTGTFSEGPELRWRRHKIGDAVVALPSGAVLVAGGAERPELYDPADRVFVPAADGLSGPQMFATATRLPTGEVLVLGGYDDRIRSSATAWLVRVGEAGRR